MNKLFKTMDEVYSHGVMTIGGQFVCSVCGNAYKRESNAHKHIDKRNCYKMRDIFEGSPWESRFFSLYKLISAINGNRGYTLKRFKKSSEYTIIAKFFVWCFTNRITEIESYAMFTMNEVNAKNPITCISLARKQTLLKKYFVYMRSHVTNEQSEKFYTTWTPFFEGFNGDEFTKSFILRALERGDISCDYLFAIHIDFEKFADSLNYIEKERLIQVLLSNE